MSIGHRALKTQRMCEMMHTAVTARSASDEAIHRRGVTDCFAALAMTGKRCRLELPLPFSPHEIEIAAFVGLQDGLVEQVRVAALCPSRCRDRRQRGAALFQLGRINQ